MNGTTRTRAQNVGELDVHIEYVQRDIEAISRALSNMATKDDIHALEQRMAAFATKDEVAALEKSLRAGTVGSAFERVTGFITKAGAAFAVIAAGAAAVAALVHFLDRVPKP
jgi:hypothetical protein